MATPSVKKTTISSSYNRHANFSQQDVSLGIGAVTFTHKMAAYDINGQVINAADYEYDTFHQERSVIYEWYKRSFSQDLCIDSRGVANIIK